MERNRQAGLGVPAGALQLVGREAAPEGQVPPAQVGEHLDGFARVARRPQRRPAPLIDTGEGEAVVAEDRAHAEAEHPLHVGQVRDDVEGRPDARRRPAAEGVGGPLGGQAAQPGGRFGEHLEGVAVPEELDLAGYETVTRVHGLPSAL